MNPFSDDDLDDSDASISTQFVTPMNMPDRPKGNYPKFVLKSSWQPPKQCRDFETFISSVESDITSHKPNNPRHDNLTKAESKALYSLQRNNDIVIKPADKGSAVVVMISEAERQLPDSRHYKPLDHDPTAEFDNKVSLAVDTMYEDGHISEKNMDFLIVDRPRAGWFYLLPKIHKAGNPGRPIVSANGYPTEKISEFVDLHLQPKVQDLPSHLKDTTDYLIKKVGRSRPGLPRNSLSIP